MIRRVVNIIPTYNEKDNISVLLSQLDRLAAAHPKYLWSALVVDDTSPDGTAKLVRRFIPKHMTIKLLSGPKRGLGVAMVRGLKHALRTMSPDIIVTNEADLAYDTNLIPRLLQKIESGWDVVLSTRHGPGAGVTGWTLNRRLNHFIANTVFAGWVAGINQIKDHNGAFRAVRVKGVLDRINWDAFPAAGFGFFNYWSFILTTLTNRIYQLPITYNFRIRGESKVSFNAKYFKTYIHDVFEYISLCLKIRISHDRPY